MIKLELELSDIDYEVLVKEILPKVADRLKQNGSPLAPLLSGGMAANVLLRASDSVRDRVRGMFGAAGLKVAGIEKRVTDTWQLGAGWASNVVATLVLETREGASARGGDLAGIGSEPASNASAANAMIDAAVTAARPPVYTSVENCPAWARETVQKAVDEGVLRGDQGGGLRLTDDNLVNLQMLRNLGLLDGGGA